MSETPDPALSLPWARWFSIPFFVFSIAMAGSFWEGRRNPAVWAWLALAAVLGYVGLSLLLNRTWIRIENGSVIVRHRPLPWLGRSFSTQNVKAVAVVTRPSKDRDTVGYELSVILHDGRTVRLTWGPIAGHRRDLLDKTAQTLAASLGVPVLNL